MRESGSIADILKRRTAASEKGVVFRFESPPDLPEDETLILVLGRDLAVTRTVRHSAAATPAAEGAKGLLEAAATRLAAIDIVAQELLGAGVSQADESGLTAAEEQELRRGGFDPEPRQDPATDPVAQARAEYASLLADSMTVKEAAKLLDASDARIRQRLADRTLYGIKDGATWQIPRLQFDGKRVVPGLDAVLPSIRADVHPVALRRWLTTANPDLPLAPAETPVSPLDWLASGGDPTPVVALAEAL